MWISTFMAWFMLQTTETTQAPQWFNKDTLFTPAGATAAVITVTTLLQRLFPQLPSRWVGLGLSFLLTLMAIRVQNSGWSPINIFLALLNGLMTYAAAIGVNTVVTQPPAAGLAKAVPAGRSYRWWA